MSNETSLIAFDDRRMKSVSMVYSEAARILTLENASECFREQLAQCVLRLVVSCDHPGLLLEKALAAIFTDPVQPLQHFSIFNEMQLSSQQIPPYGVVLPLGGRSQ